MAEDYPTATICNSVIKAAGPPGPLAISTDLLAASAALEDANYATDGSTCGNALAKAAAWVRRAQDHAGQVGDEDLAHRCACAASNLEAWSTLAANKSGGDLVAWQQTTLYPYQGVLAALLDQGTSDAQAPANLAFAGALGALLVVFGADLWIGWKQQHGGYSRGPRPRVEPVVSYRY